MKGERRGGGIWFGLRPKLRTGIGPPRRTTVFGGEQRGGVIPRWMEPTRPSGRMGDPAAAPQRGERREVKGERRGGGIWFGLRPKLRTGIGPPRRTLRFEPPFFGGWGGDFRESLRNRQSLLNCHYRKVDGEMWGAVCPVLLHVHFKLVLQKLPVTDEGPNEADIGAGERFRQANEGLHHASVPEFDRSRQSVVGGFRLCFVLLRFVLRRAVRHSLLWSFFLWNLQLRRGLDGTGGELLRFVDGRY